MGSLGLQPLVVLRQLLVKHDHDARYQTPALKARLAELYMPFFAKVRGAHGRQGTGSRGEGQHGNGERRNQSATSGVTRDLLADALPN